MSEGFTLIIPLDEFYRLARDNAIRLNLPIDVNRIGTVPSRGRRRARKKSVAQPQEAPNAPASADPLQPLSRGARDSSARRRRG